MHLLVRLADQRWSARRRRATMLNWFYAMSDIVLRAVLLPLFALF